MTEHAEQEHLFGLAKQMEQYVPEMGLLHAIPNESMAGWYKTKKGNRYNPTLTRLKKEGLQGGVPDVCLPVARNGYHGFYIEMKWGKNYLSEKQRYWCVALIEQGYRVDVHYNGDDAFKALCNYLGEKVRFIW
jgi:hypothetical protein